MATAGRSGDGIRGMGLDAVQRDGRQGTLESFAVGHPKVLVIGCGGAGGNSIHRLHRIGVRGAKTLVVNTDAVHLDSIQCDRKLLIGAGVTRGMGAGGRPEVGERCAELATDELRNLVADADLTFVTLGLGGGTGTGVAPHVAELAVAAGSVVLVLATTPFRAERGRMRHAVAGIQRLKATSDAVIVLDNDRLLDLVPTLPVEQAFAVMDHLISEVVKGVTESITVPSLINLDFNDVQTILQSGGTSTVFYGENSDEDPDRVVADTLDNPLLDVDHRGARGALIHMSAGPSLRLRTAHEVVEGLTAEMRPDANVIFGVRVDRRYEGIIRVLSIMTGVRSPFLESVAQQVSLDDVDGPPTRGLPLNPSSFLRSP
ncbi:MAG: cell division protein FtsZ [Methanobacteriota archaeon]